MHLDDIAISALPDARRRAFRVQNVGAVFQEFELLEYLDVRDNILLPYRISSDLSPRRRRTRDRAESPGGVEVGLADKLDRPPGRLSHGEKQRVAICRAVVTEPAPPAG